jgi:lipase chaperone LimK
MEVEKAIEHILQIQAAAEGRMDKMERQLGAISNLMRAGIKLVINIREAQNTAEFKINALIDAGQRTEQRLAELADSGQRTDQRLAELAKVQAKSDQRFDHKMAELADAQKVTEKKLASFIDALKKNKTNGHN